MPEFKFELPKKPEDLGEIVSAVPINWSWIDGVLLAPDNLYREGTTIASNTRLILSRFKGVYYRGQIDYPSDFTGTRLEDREGRTLPIDVAAVTLGRRLPSSIAFDEAGYEHRWDTPMETLIEVASGFLTKGYQGRICFYSGCVDNDKYANPARFGIDSTLNVRYSPSLDGAEKDIAPILHAIKKLGLKAISLDENNR